MVFPEHWYVAFGGTAYSGHEQWQCGIRLAGGTIGSSFIDDALADVADDVKKFCQATGSAMPTSHTLTYCKLNRIGPDGNYADEGTSNTFIYAPAISGSVAAVQIPQAAVVVSLLTDAEFGRASKGRFYWLGAGYPLGLSSAGDPGLNDPQCTALATAAWTLMQDLGNWPGLDVTGLAPSVVSSVGVGAWRHVTRVRVDSRFDVQRRRAKGIAKSAVTKP